VPSVLPSSTTMISTAREAAVAADSTDAIVSETFLSSFSAGIATVSELMRAS
jgi:hypothetical protein